MAPHYVLNPVAIRALLTSDNGPVGVDIVRRTYKVANAAKRLCPVAYGRLRGSIRPSLSRDARGLVGLVGTDVDYALCVHNGTRPHDIYSKGPWPLRNRRTGQVFGPVVHHPGTKAQPFLLDALKEART